LEVIVNQTSSNLPEVGGVKLTPKIIAVAVAAVLAVVFVFQNTDTASLKIIFFTVEMPTWIAFLALLAIGVGIGYFVRGHRDKQQ
jgi:uncharacterized integral membrane protein